MEKDHIDVEEDEEDVLHGDDEVEEEMEEHQAIQLDQDSPSPAPNPASSPVVWHPFPTRSMLRIPLLLLLLLLPLLLLLLPCQLDLAFTIRNFQTFSLSFSLSSIWMWPAFPAPPAPPLRPLCRFLFP